MNFKCGKLCKELNILLTCSANKISHQGILYTFKQKSNAYFNLRKNIWKKHHVCLTVRSFKGDIGFINEIITSGQLFWNKHIGRKVLVMDHDEYDLTTIIGNSEWEFFTEEFPDSIKNKGFIAKQWSNMMSYNYCPDEDYIAITDTDSPFTTMVTYDLLFNSSGYPYVMASWDFQKHLWPNNMRIVDVNWKLNGMVKLPFVIKKTHLIECIHFLEKIHKKTLDIILLNANSFSQMCVMAMWLYKFKRNEYDFRIIEEDKRPIIQYGAHIPYLIHGYAAKKHSDQFHNVCTKIAFNGICSVFPPDTFDLCPENIDYSYYWEYAGIHFKTENKYRNEVFHNHFDPIWAEFNISRNK